MKALDFNDYLYEQLLLEVGEGTSDSFEIKHQVDLGDGFEHYFFTVDNLDYKIEFSTFEDEDFDDALTANIDFGVIEGKNGINMNITTNKGFLFQIMSTVVKAIKEYLKKNSKVTSLFITPSKNGRTDMRRSKLYQMFLKKHLRSGDVVVDDVGDIRVFDL